EKYTLKEIIFPDRKKLSNIITLAVINLVLFLASISIIFFIPAIIVYLTTIFCSCYVFDKNISIIEAIFESKNATGGHKIQLLGLMVKLLFPITVILLLSLMLAGSSNKLLIFPFVLSFSYSIAMLMFQRIVALLYYSFEDSGMDNEC
ncbi:MAG: hypothetical protein Q8942_12440, partial [Bacillota bacterium]|nr:hypothetical protein [Bacillota bacterium]